MSKPKETENLSDREDFYLYKRPDIYERTKARLIKIQEIGMTETGIASFGIKGVMSGLYIEKVWDYSDEDFNSYLEWVIELKKQKQNGNNGQ